MVRVLLRFSSSKPGLCVRETLDLLDLRTLKVLRRGLEDEVADQRKNGWGMVGKNSYVAVLSKKAEFDVLNKLLKDCNALIEQKESFSDGSSF